MTVTSTDFATPDEAAIKRALVDLFVSQGVDRSLVGKHIKPVVIDTNVLLNDMAQTVKRGHRTAMLESAALGTIRLFAADHIEGEVAEHLPTYAAARKLGHRLEELRSVWDDAYRPQVRFVAVPQDIHHDLVARVRARDPDDAPTAALACLLAPCLVFTEDTDLVDHELVPNADRANWLARALSARDEAHADIVIAGGVRLTAQLAAITWESLAAIPAAWRPAALAAVAGGVALLWQRGALSPAARAQVLEQLRPLLERVGQAARARHLRQEALSGALFLPQPGNETQRLVAHHLAAAPDPLSGRALTETLHTRGAQLDANTVRAILRDGSPFVAVGKYRWQVGKVRPAIR
jgi:predicted nucleic acid-binding protein